MVGLSFRHPVDRGCPTVDGLGMLVNQGVIGITYWTAVDAEAGVMRRKLEEIYREA